MQRHIGIDVHAASWTLTVNESEMRRARVDSTAFAVVSGGRME